MKTIRNVAIAFAIILFGIIIAKILGNQKKPMERSKSHKQQVKVVQGKKVEKSDIRVNIPITGKVSAIDHTDIYAEVSGILLSSKISFKEGTHFIKGELLLKIDDTEARLNLLAQKSNLLNVITQLLPDLKLDFPESYPNWKKYLDKFDLKRPLAELPHPVTDKEKYYIATRNLYNLFFTIKSQETRLEKYSIRAPYDGVITEANINEGTLVRIGQKLGSCINQDSYELKISLSLDELEFISLNNNVRLKSNEISGSWTGKVVRISEKLDPGTQTVNVFINIHENHLKDGMYLNGYIVSNVIKNKIEIPRKLLSDKNTMFVIKNDTLKEITVDLVKLNQSTAIISGLKNGAMILNEVIVGAYDGMPVTFSKAGKKK